MRPRKRSGFIHELRVVMAVVQGVLQVLDMYV
jgi:hypothetical protein